MTNELEKQTAVYELLRASVPPAEIIRLLRYPRRTVYNIKNVMTQSWQQMATLQRVLGNRPLPGSPTAGAGTRWST